MSKSELPLSIKNMIKTDYVKGLSSSESAERINRSATARKLNISLTTQQVAAHKAWITMRGF